MKRLGILSDTHGLLRSEALAFLRGCDHIVHAGDIGSQDILASLSCIAPVTVVRGNNDRGPWAAAIPEAAVARIGDTALYVIHDLSGLAIDPVAANIQVVVSGHSHAPRIEWRDGILFLNPGSAGPRRFKLPISIAEITIERGRLSPRIVDLAPSRAT